MKPKILLIEDDASLGLTIEQRLKKEGYPIHWSKAISEAKLAFVAFQPEILVIDIRLPDGSGFSLPDLLGIRDKKVPFLFLTAQAGAENRLKGFELGAEEFIPKPFHLKELLLRLEKLTENLRKSKGAPRYKVGSLEVQLEAFQVISQSQERFPLSAREAQLLGLLLENKDRVLSRNEILDCIVGEHAFPSLRVIDNSIVRLREILGEESIRNVRGIGYQFVAECEPLL